MNNLSLTIDQEGLFHVHDGQRILNNGTLGHKDRSNLREEVYQSLRAGGLGLTVKTNRGEEIPITISFAEEKPRDDFHEHGTKIVHYLDIHHKGHRIGYIDYDATGNDMYIAFKTLDEAYRGKGLMHAAQSVLFTSGITMKKKTGTGYIEDANRASTKTREGLRDVVTNKQFEVIEMMNDPDLGKNFVVSALRD